MSINKILIVDDSLTMLENLKGIIVDYGIVPETANNGQIAIEKALVSIPDLIFLDIVMPEMDSKNR
jgi:two-component system, OmpR family, alkaline phosphatase synthesis response regulator PhoP